MAKKFINFLFSTEESIIALDSKWGNGKTFICKQAITIINESHAQINQDVPNKDEYLDIPYDSLMFNSSYSVYYNAWENDNDNDPMISFLYYLIKKLDFKFTSDKFKQFLKYFLTSVIEKIFDGILKFSKETTKLEDILASVIDSETVKESISGLLKELKSEKCNQFVIFIDELDRYGPNYAIRVIEMLKQYILVPGITIICSADLNELSKSPQSLYGNEFNCYGYLDKIFDCRYELHTLKIYYKKVYRIAF